MFDPEKLADQIEKLAQGAKDLRAQGGIASYLGPVQVQHGAGFDPVAYVKDRPLLALALAAGSAIVLRRVL